MELKMNSLLYIEVDYTGIPNPKVIVTSHFYDTHRCCIYETVA